VLASPCQFFGGDWRGGFGDEGKRAFSLTVKRSRVTLANRLRCVNEGALVGSIVHDDTFQYIRGS
jgi:hypothetical protein